MRGLTGTELVLACVKKALGLDLYCTLTAASSSELTVGVPLLAWRQGLMNRKNYCIELES